MLVLSLLAACPIAVNRAVKQGGGNDTYKFYAAGRYVLEHGEIEPTAFMKYYWPSIDVAFAGLAWMPLPMFAVVWYAIGCASWIGLLWAIHGLLKGPRVAARGLTPPRQATLAAGLLMTPLAMDNLCLGAFHVLMLWLMVAGMGRVSRGRSWSGGILLGLGVWIKLLPLLGVGYLVLKRKWLAAGVAVVSAIVVDLALALPVFGPAKTWDLHARWWGNQAQGATGRTLSSVGWIDEDRITNQSLAQMLRRLLTHMGWRDASPQSTDPFKERNAVALADLSPGQLRAIYLAIAGALGLSMLFYCRRPGRSLSPGRWAAEIALVSLGTLWFSPVAWGYHFTAVTPALAVIAARRPTEPRLAWTAAALWLVGLASFGWRLAHSVGVLLWVTLVLGVILVYRQRGQGRGMSDDRQHPPADP